jgi:hypothetical protein
MAGRMGEFGDAVVTDDAVVDVDGDGDDGTETVGKTPWLSNDIVVSVLPKISIV